MHLSESTKHHLVSLNKLRSRSELLKLKDFVKDESMDPLDREWIWMRHSSK